MKSDFSLLRAAEAGTSPCFALVPGGCDAAAARAATVFITRRAFGFLEAGLSAAWPGYARQASKRECVLSPEVCAAFCLRLGELRAALLHADASAAAGGLARMMPAIQAQAEHEAVDIRLGLMQLIEALCAWLSAPPCAQAGVRLVQL